MFFISINMLLAEYFTTPLSRIVTFKLVGFQAQIGLFKHGPQILNWGKSDALERPFQQLNISLLYPFQNHFGCVWHQCPNGTPVSHCQTLCVI